MVVVFLAFLAAPDVFLKLFGIGLVAAIFLDATVVPSLGRGWRIADSKARAAPTAIIAAIHDPP